MFSDRLDSGTAVSRALALCYRLPQLFVCHGLTIKIPGTIDGMNDIHVEVVLRLLATREFVDDVCRILEETGLPLGST